MERESTDVRSLAIEIKVDYAVVRPTAGENPPPLVLIFHGWGQTCRSIIRRFQPLRDSSLLLVAPQAPHPFYVSTEPKKVGFTGLTQYERARAVDEFRVYMRRLLDRLAAEESFDAGRIVVVGYSQGVSMAYRLAISDVLTPAGLVACNGDLPPDGAEKLPGAPRFPVLLIHGEGDPLVPKSKCDEAFQILTAQGFSVDHWIHKGGHELPPSAVQQIAAWLSCG